jgi:hypothetical protein
MTPEDLDEPPARRPPMLGRLEQFERYPAAAQSRG